MPQNGIRESSNASAMTRLVLVVVNRSKACMHEHPRSGVDSSMCRTSDLGDGEAGLGGGQQVHVVAADARRQRQLQLGRPLQALLRHVRRPEGLQVVEQYSKR